MSGSVTLGLRRPVAIKVLADSLALDPGYVSSFEREALVAARLSHPNLVGVFDFSAGEPRPYLVMEYVPGGTLADQLRARRREAWDPQTVFKELTSALAHVHAAGIIHRDIKPANVLIGPDGRARLTDFGVARPSDAERLTRTGVVVGTARYIAPEVMRGQQPDERSDLYACGVLLHECLRGDDPQHLRAMVDRLTSEHPEKRPASAAEVLDLLDQPATGATALMPSKPGPGTSTKPTLARRRFRSAGLRPGRAAVAAGAIALVLVVLLIVLSTGGSGGRRSSSAQSVARPPANAALSTQLGYLDRVIAQARR